MGESSRHVPAMIAAPPNPTDLSALAAARTICEVAVAADPSDALLASLDVTSIVATQEIWGVETVRTIERTNSTLTAPSYPFTTKPFFSR